MIITFTHKLQVRLDQVSFKPPDGRKARNIYGIVLLGDGNDELAIMRSRWSNTLSKSDVTDVGTTRTGLRFSTNFSSSIYPLWFR